VGAFDGPHAGQTVKIAVSCDGSCRNAASWLRRLHERAGLCVTCGGYTVWIRKEAAQSVSGVWDADDAKHYRRSDQSVAWRV